jgi:hypothetical protein
VKGVPYPLWSHIIALSCPDIAVREQLLDEYQRPVLGNLTHEYAYDYADIYKLCYNGLVKNHPHETLDPYGKRTDVKYRGNLPPNYRVGYKVKPYITGFFNPDGTASLWGATAGIIRLNDKIPFITNKEDFAVMNFTRWHRLFSNGRILPWTTWEKFYGVLVASGKYDQDCDTEHTRTLKVKRGLKGPLVKEVTEYWKLKNWIDNEVEREHNLAWKR